METKLKAKVAKLYVMIQEACNRHSAKEMEACGWKLYKQIATKFKVINLALGIDHENIDYICDEDYWCCQVYKDNLYDSIHPVKILADAIKECDELLQNRKVTHFVEFTAIRTYLEFIVFNASRSFY